MAHIAQPLADIAASERSAAEPGPLPKVLHVGRIPLQRQWHMRTHSHPDHHQLILVLKGQLAVQIMGRHYLGHGGQALFYPRGVAHAESAAGGAALETLFVGWRDCSGIEWDHWPTIVIDRNGRIEFLLRWMLELANQHPPDSAALGALMRAAAAEFAAQATVAEDPIIARVRRYVQQHLGRDMQLQDLADAACLSIYHFSRLFKRATGRSPMRYVVEARVQAARGLIRTTPAPLKQIARMVGIRDEFHLSRVFQRIEGVAPGSLRGSSSRGTR